MKWLYSDEVKEHFTNPKNVLEDEESFKEDGIGETGSAVCGDMMNMLIKVDKEKGIITDCKWKTYGCASAIASTSVLSEMVIGMKLEEAYKLKPKDILEKLKGLPNNKIHCSVLGDKALRNAIDDYYKRNNINNTTKGEIENIVCKCMDVSRIDIKKAVLEKDVNSFEELQKLTKIATGCGSCEVDARSIFEEFLLEKEEENVKSN